MTIPKRNIRQGQSTTLRRAFAYSFEGEPMGYETSEYQYPSEHFSLGSTPYFSTYTTNQTITKGERPNIVKMVANGKPK